MTKYTQMSEKELESYISELEGQIDDLETELAELEGRKDAAYERLEEIRGLSVEEVFELAEADRAYERGKEKIKRYYGRYPIESIRDMKWWEVK